MKNKLVCLMILLLIYPATLLAQTGTKESAPPPTMTVTGHGKVFAAPDRAIVRLGVISQEKEAAEAQAQASAVVGRAIEQLKQLGIPSEKITTVGLTLTPVYSRQSPTPRQEPVEPAIIAYRARNTIKVVIDDLSRVGNVIDTSVKAGANQLEGVSFELKDDAKYSDQALRLAVREARRKADAIADALGVAVQGVEEISEGGIDVVRPQMHMARAFSAEASTPIEPGQVGVDASVTIKFSIAGGDKSHDAAKTGS